MAGIAVIGGSEKAKRVVVPDHLEGMVWVFTWRSGS
jgi:hypothetical protein